MTVTIFDDKKDQLEQGIEFQRTKDRIRNIVRLPIDDLGKPSGAPTKPIMNTSELGRDDLVTLFRRMLDVGTLEYEHQLAEFLHNGPPNMDYVWIESTDKLDTRTPDQLLVASVAIKVKAEREAADMQQQANKTLVVTNKEDIDVQSNEKSDFQCYIPACKFVTNSKATYERHVLTGHPRSLCYPGRVDIKQRGWTAQGRKWEI